MSKIVTIEKKVCIDSEFLSKDIKTYIFNKLKEITATECSKEYGYFLNIVKLINIKDNYISSNCQNIFIVIFDAEILKPEVGKIFEGVVCMIFGSGIFINIYNKLKVLIPLSSITEYEYNSVKNHFEKKTKIIKQNDIVKVKISGTKYSKQSYSCFGTIEED